MQTNKTEHGFSKWKTAVVILVVLFIASVAALTFYGRHFEKVMEAGDSTQIYIDMATNANIDRLYDKAEENYKLAIAVAEKNYSDGAPLEYALYQYSYFLFKRKRLDEARKIEDRARALSIKLHPQAPLPKSPTDSGN